MHPTLPPRSVRFRPNHAASIPFTSKNALPAFGRIVERNNPDRHFEVIFDLFFDFARAVPVCEGKATVDFRFCGIFGRIENLESTRECRGRARRILPSALTLWLSPLDHAD